MHASKRLSLALAALAAAGLTGCLNSLEPVGAPLAASAAALDSTATDSAKIRPPKPARPDSLRTPPACGELTVLLAAADTASPLFHNLRRQVGHVCSLPKPPRPDSLRPERPAKPDSLRPVSPVKPDSVRPVPPPPPKPDSLRPAPGKPRPPRPDAGTAPGAP